MPPKSALLATALAAVFAAAPASATTLVTSLAAFKAGAATAVNSPNPGAFDTKQVSSPVTATISLNDGTTLGLSNSVAVTSPDPGGFPYKIADGFNGEIFIPQDSLGNYLTSETISFSNDATALGFEVAPYSNSAGAPNFGVPSGPFNVTVTLNNGQTSTVSLPGGNLNTATTASQFFGFLGGGVTSLTISSTDPTAIGFGNFYDVSVPEPASAALVVVGLAGLFRGRRRTAIA